jgi:hypothetical protein
MKGKQMVPIALAAVAIMLATYGLFSYGWYLEQRETDNPDEEGVIKTDLGYGIRGVSNHTRYMFNGTLLDEEETVHSYDEFIGDDNLAGQVASTMWTLMLIGILMTVIFIPLAYISQTGGLEARIGKWGPYLPLYVAQVAAVTLIVSPIWFTYEFIVGLDIDMNELTNAPSQAVGDMSGWLIVFAGVLVQAAAFMAISRTRLIYIEPLDEAKTPEPLR